MPGEAFNACGLGGLNGLRTVPFVAISPYALRLVPGRAYIRDIIRPSSKSFAGLYGGVTNAVGIDALGELDVSEGFPYEELDLGTPFVATSQ